MRPKWQSTGFDFSSVAELAGTVPQRSPLLPAASARKVVRHCRALNALCRTWSITMKLTARVWFLLLTGLLSPAVSATAAEDLPEMKFNEVKEVAPGVFFRYSAISPKDVGFKIFGASNNLWVVFEDYVVVLAANSPKAAAAVV